MDDGLKQRLVGAIVLCALGVLFLPSIFESDSLRRVDMTRQIPLAPIIEPISVKPPVRNAAIDTPKPAKEMYRLLPSDSEKTETSPVQAATQKPVSNLKAAKNPSVVLNDKGVPQAWAVQMASYTSQKSADVFLKKLHKNGYQAFSKALNTSKGPVVRVYVGPKISKQVALSLKSKLEKQYQLSTLLVRFEP